MFGQRSLEKYNKFSAPRSEPTILHRTFLPEVDDIDKVRFDVRSSGKDAHLSSTMYLERTFTVQIQLPSMANEKYVLASGADHTRKYRAVDHQYNTVGLKFMRSPGFALQNNASDFFFQCDAGTINSDPRFLQNYTKLYKDDLKQFIRGSGKSFSNHNDKVQRTQQLNVTTNNDTKVYMQYCNRPLVSIQ